MEVGVSLTLLPVLRPFTSYWAALSNLDMRLCVKSYCKFKCCFFFIISLRGLLFSEGKWRKSSYGGEGTCGRGKEVWIVACNI